MHGGGYVNTSAYKKELFGSHMKDITEAYQKFIAQLENNEIDDKRFANFSKGLGGQLNCSIHDLNRERFSSQMKKKK